MNPNILAALAEISGVWCIDDRLVDPRRFIDWLGKVKAEAKQDAEAAVTVRKASVGGGRSVAEVRLQGLLMKSIDWFGTATAKARREIRAAREDSEVAGILLHVDSPGGLVAGTDDLAQEVKAANRVKPVWGFAEDLAASAGYWPLSQTDKIYANSPTALVGSIGTFQVVHDVSEMFEKDGIKTHLIATGPLKGWGAMGTKVTDEQLAHLQAVVDGLQSSFDDAVQKGRGLGAKELAAVKSGGAFLASDALDKRLIDGIASRDKVLSEFSKELSGSKRSGRTAALTPNHSELLSTVQLSLV